MCVAFKRALDLSPAEIDAYNVLARKYENEIKRNTRPYLIPDRIFTNFMTDTDQGASRKQTEKARLAAIEKVVNQALTNLAREVEEQKVFRPSGQRLKDAFKAAKAAWNE